MNIPDFLSMAKTYRVDLELFNKLGLNPFTVHDKEELFVGEYKVPEYNNVIIKIWVSCWPAQFWRFEIDTSEGGKYSVETGSGSLTSYWDSVMQIAESMFVVKKL